MADPGRTPRRRSATPSVVTARRASAPDAARAREQRVLLSLLVSGVGDGAPHRARREPGLGRHDAFVGSLRRRRLGHRAGARALRRPRAPARAAAGARGASRHRRGRPHRLPRLPRDHRVGEASVRDVLAGRHRVARGELRVRELVPRCARLGRRALAVARYRSADARSLGRARRIGGRSSVGRSRSASRVRATKRGTSGARTGSAWSRSCSSGARWGDG